MRMYDHYGQSDEFDHPPKMTTRTQVLKRKAGKAHPRTKDTCWKSWVRHNDGAKDLEVHQLTCYASFKAGFKAGQRSGNRAAWKRFRKF